MRRRYQKRRTKEPPELNITTFLNLMVVLIPFLLISAVFSRITIVELSVPTGAGGSSNQPNFSVEVIVRENGLELADGSRVIAAIPMKDDEYDMDRLSQLLLRIKAEYPEKEDATVLMEPQIEYDHLIAIMDMVRSAELQESDQEIERKLLFPNISIGDAP